MRFQNFSQKFDIILNLHKIVVICGCFFYPDKI